LFLITDQAELGAYTESPKLMIGNRVTQEDKSLGLNAVTRLTQLKINMMAKLTFSQKATEWIGSINIETADECDIIILTVQETCIRAKVHRKGCDLFIPSSNAKKELLEILSKTKEDLKLREIHSNPNW
jgi:hypothetical protein